MSQLLKRKILAILFIFTAFIPSIGSFLNGYDLVYLVIIISSTLLFFVILTLIALKNSVSTTLMFRRKDLDEREQNMVHSNRYIIMAVLLCSVLFQWVFSIIISYGFYFISPSLMNLYYSKMQIINFDLSTFDQVGKFGLLAYALLFAIPLLRDRDIDDEEEEFEHNKYKNQSNFLFQAISFLILLGTISATIYFVSLRQTRQIIATNIPEFTAIRAIGRYDLNIKISDGPYKISISGPAYLVNKLEYIVKDKSKDNQIGGFSENSKAQKELNILSTSRESITNLFGELKINVEIPRLESLDTAYYTNVNLAGKCLEGDVVDIYNQLSKINNLCVNPKNQLNVFNYPGFDYMPDSQVYYQTISSQNTIPKIEISGQYVDLNRAKGEKLIFVTGYDPGSTIFDSTSFIEVIKTNP
jgi:hypothetical protein